MSVKRTLLIGGAVVAGFGSLGYMLRRARINSARVLPIAGSNPPEVRVVLTYGNGTRPLSVIIDLVGGSGASGSATIEGETTEALIPLSAPLTSTYSITTTATYRLFGIANMAAWTFEGVIA